MTLSASDDTAATFASPRMVRPTPAAGDQARAVFDLMMGLVAVTVGFRALGSRPGGAVGDLFVEDGVLNLGSDQIVTGRVALRQSGREVEPVAWRIRHAVTTVRFVSDGAGAASRRHSPRGPRWSKATGWAPRCRGMSVRITTGSSGLSTGGGSRTGCGRSCSPGRRRKGTGADGDHRVAAGQVGTVSHPGGGR